MPSRSLRWQLFVWLALAALAAVALTSWLSLSRLEHLYLERARTDLAASVEFLDLSLGPEVDDEPREFYALSRHFDQAYATRVAVVLPSGKVTFDSQGRPSELDHQVERPELQRALGGESVHWVRFLTGLDQRVMYLAAPLYRHDVQVAVLFLSKPLADLEHAVAQLRMQLIACAAAAVLLTAAFAWWAGKKLARPINEIALVTSQLAAGQWSARIAMPEQRELAQLSESVNRLASQIQQKISVLIQNNNEQKAVLASMAEGVLAVDSQGQLISLNTASGRLLGLDQAQAKGRRLHEIVRNADLIRFINRALACTDPIEADVLLHGERQRVMQAHGSALHDLEGRAIGAVIVLNDVTDFRRLEHIRRDFVANVSHELKTPVTSIKGFVETLLDGAMHDTVDAERFLRIIAKQADRLHAIIEDLLSLSKIEQSEDRDEISLEFASLRPVLDSAVNTCHGIRTDRNVDIELTCDAQLKAQINPMLFEQVIVNLLDNAIKYSEPGQRVELVAQPADNGITVAVTDHGCGIASEHLARIFERFYRVDRARSRKLGGTGLGLAIVKHIVQAHRGRIDVDSTLGVGSTFTIHLPFKQ